MTKNIPELQKKVEELYKKNNWKTDPTLLLVAMQEELGELCARWLAEHPGYKKNIKRTHPLSDEIGDLTHLILAFCNTQDINFEEAVLETIKKRGRQA